MKAGISIGISVCLAANFASFSGAAPFPGNNPRDDDPRQLIERLADEDPAVRQSAEEKLLRMGVAARPEVVLASRSDNPAIASRAAEILLALPFYRPDDPLPIRQILIDYGKRDEPQRIESLTRLVQFSPESANPVLLRLLVEDPSEDVCWQIVTLLRRSLDYGTIKSLRILPLEPMRAAALTMVGRAWYGRDRAKALLMLRKAVEMDCLRPTYDSGELDYAFDRLVQDAVMARRFDEAALLRRMQCERIGVTRDAYPSPVFELFALHAQFGPLEGFHSDLARFSMHTAQPQVLYSIGKVYQRCDSPLLAHLCFDAGSVTSLTPAHRLLVAQFLMQMGWNDLAERELRALLRSEEAEGAYGVINANLRLAALARTRGEDAASAQFLENVSKLMGPRTAELQRTTSDGRGMPFSLSGEIAFLRFCAARARNDQPQQREQLELLLASRPHSSEVLLEIIPYLRTIGRDDDAARLFEDAYSGTKEILSGDPENPALLNELAWLCARSGERPQEALKLANRAIADEPDNAAYLDTAAEAHFRVGKVPEAIRLESRALELEPGDKFMTEQLERFRNALKN